jgi:hypothetical protein
MKSWQSAARPGRIKAHCAHVHVLLCCAVKASREVNTEYCKAVHSCTCLLQLCVLTRTQQRLAVLAGVRYQKTPLTHVMLLLLLTCTADLCSQGVPGGEHGVQQGHAGPGRQD